MTIILAAGLAIAAATAPVAAASPFPTRIQLPPGWMPEGITAGAGTTIYVGSLAGGGVWRGNVSTGLGDVFVPAWGGAATGVEYESGANRLWVAGGPTGTVRVYDATTGELLRAYTFAPAGFLNDLVVTATAVYVTDSFNAWLDVIPLGPNGALPATDAVTTLPLSGITFEPGQFNANGIVATRGWLLVVDSFTGGLFRVDPTTGTATEVSTIGIAYAVASAAAIVAMSKATGETEHLKDMLVGNILAVSWPEVGRTALLYGGIGLFHYIFRHRFLAISMDPRKAEASGIMIWQLSGDAPGSKSLLEAIHEAVMEK
jgi:hypothetical protein